MPGCFGDQVAAGRVGWGGQVSSLTAGRAGSASPGVWGSAVRASSPAGGDRTCGGFSGPLAHFISCSASDKELSASPSSPPLPHPAGLPSTGIWRIEAAQPSSDTSKTFLPRGWGVPGSPGSTGGRHQRWSRTGAAAPLQRGLISLGVIPLAKDLMMAEGREVPLEGQALFSSRPVALVPGRRL